MTKDVDKEGILRMQPSGRWAVCRPDQPPIEIASGDVFRIQVDGMPLLQPTRMEFKHFQGPMKPGTPLGHEGCGAA